MKFADIKPFTTMGSYTVDIPFRYLKERIEQWIAEDGLQLCPDFQRGHVWTQEQQIRYVEFLLREGHSSRTIYFNHPGWMKSWEGDFVVVDGLQRLTACTAFLGNEIPAFGTICKDFEDKLPMNVTIQFNINDLKTRAEVLQWYIDLNSGGVAHTDEEIKRVRLLLSQEQVS